MAPSILPGVAFVTGGARGLGNDIAVAFAREGCPSIVIVDILPDEEMEKGRREVEKHNAQVRTMHEKAKQKVLAILTCLLLVPRNSMRCVERTRSPRCYCPNRR